MKLWSKKYQLLLTFMLLLIIYILMDVGVLKSSHYEGDYMDINYVEDVSSERTDLKTYSLPDCNCKRAGKKLNPSVPDSMCSNYATSRGTGQKVISYCYFNNTDHYDDFLYEKYLNSLNSRLQEARSLYPGWVVRVYHNVSDKDTIAQRTLCQLYCENSNLDLCTVSDIPRYKNKYKNHNGVFWRYLVMGDPTVDIFLARDTDSQIQRRELEAVEEWLASSKTFHAIRDHPGHLFVLLAGLWGAKNYRRPKDLLSLRNQILNMPQKTYYGYDQVILKTVLWPQIKDDVLQHDSFLCEKEDHRNSVPFPKKRKTDIYVGWGPIGKEKSLQVFQLAKCPKKCRPVDHQDWEKC